MKMKMTIWFDMDGTIADLYAVNGWLDSLRKFETRPYEEARPMFNFSVFEKQLHLVQEGGTRIGIVTWGSKVATDDYNKAVKMAKIEWLNKHLPTIEWDEFVFLPYGTNKSTIKNSPLDILFDDEECNRTEWDKVLGLEPEPKRIEKVLRDFSRHY